MITRPIVDWTGFFIKGVKSVKEQIEKVKQQFQSEIAQVSSMDALEAMRVAYLGKKRKHNRASEGIKIPKRRREKGNGPVYQ